jgi:nucleoside-diphosphate-sugar epimerase
MKCIVTGTPYTVYGYKGKQVRDNIHSADLIQAFLSFLKRHGLPKYITQVAVATVIVQ